MRKDVVKPKTKKSQDVYQDDIENTFQHELDI